ncbi:MAG: hypothetical protein D6732_09235 [Methanobacteriota archaeon]|nr:MAG: hypothetical protein D6732_09235 [Euryarchaeota archaeon]
MALQLISLQLLLKALNSDAMAQWFVFSAIFGVASMLEGGTGVVLTQQIAQKGRYSKVIFTKAVMLIYFILACVVGVVAILFGHLWLSAQDSLSLKDQDIYLWWIFVLGGCFFLLGWAESSIVTGMGEVASAQRNALMGQAIYVILFFLLYVEGGAKGLELPVFSSVVSNIFLCGLNTWTLRRLLGKCRGRISRNYFILVGKSLMSSTSKNMLNLASHHLLSSAFLLLISAFQPAKVVAGYGVSVRLFSIVSGLSDIWMSASFPRLAANKNNLCLLHDIYKSAMIRGVPLLVIGFLLVVFLGPPVIEFYRGENIMLPFDELWVLGLMLATEQIVFSLGWVLLSQGYFGTVARFSALFSITVLATAYIGLALFNWGVKGVLLSRIAIRMIVYDIPVGRRAIRVMQGGV